MKVIINKKEIEFSLENEKTAFEVFSSIRDWGIKRGLVIGDLTLNQKDVLFDTEEANDFLAKISTDAIEVIDVTFDRATNYALSFFDETKEYFERIQAKTKKENPFTNEEIDTLIENFTFVKEGLHQASRVLGLELELIDIKILVKKIEVFSFSVKRRRRRFCKSRKTI